MKNFQLHIIAFGLTFMVWIVSATPVDVNELRDKELNSRNCTVVVNNATNLEVGEQEQLEEPEPSEEFKAEIRRHFEQLEHKPLDDDRDKRQSSGGIYHGNSVALQTTTRYLWLGCSGHCGTYSCPLVFFSGNDWTTRCWGEIFRIYRLDGPGYVRVGDYVGIYYIAANRWLGCAHSNCGKYDCPGSPDWTYGFSSREKWYRCGGEVFRIYARGKGTGSTINAYDDVMFYYVGNGQWLSLQPLENAVKRPCPGSVRPPPFSKYDVCWGEVFNIHKR